MPNAVRSIASRPPRPCFLRRFAAARRAATAVEFALLAPLLALGAVGLAEPAGAPAAHSDGPVTASTVGDLAAQSAWQAAQAR